MGAEHILSKGLIPPDAQTSLFSMLVPDGLVLLAAVGLLRPTGLPAWTATLVLTYDYLLLGAAVFLGWYIGLSRVVFATLLLVLVDGALGPFSAQDRAASEIGRTVFNAVGLLGPLNWLALSLIQERQFVVRRDLALGSVGLIQVLLVTWLCVSRQSEFAAAVAGSLETTFIAPLYTQWTSLSQPALLAFGVAFVLLTARFLHEKSRLDRGFVWALVAVFLALHGSRLGWSTTNYLGTAGLILLVATYADEYRVAYYDDMTRIQGRLALERTLPNLGSRYALAIVDIDDMKRVNKRYGYALGNSALQLVAKQLATVSGCEAFRHEADRFVLLFHRKSVADVLPVLEAIRVTVENSSISLPRQWLNLRSFKAPRAGPVVPKELVVTISIGVAERNHHLTKPESVMKRAGQALLRAKRAGGNEIRALA
jgi:GGDEF domain-containing protein